MIVSENEPKLRKIATFEMVAKEMALNEMGSKT